MARSCQHDESECRDCFKERIRSIGLGSGTTPTRDNTNWQARRNRQPTNSWEKGQPVDDRGMPYLDAKGNRVSQKTFAETRHRYRQHQKPVEVRPIS